MLYRFRKTLAGLLSLLMAVTLTQGCAKKSVSLRHTAFFTPQPHTDLRYDEIEYETIESAPLTEEADALRALMSDAANIDEFETRFFALIDKYTRCCAMAYIVMNRMYANAADMEAAEEYYRASTETLIADNAVTTLIRDALSSPCAPVLEKHLSDEVRESYLEIQDLDDTFMDLRAQDQELQNEFSMQSVGNYAAEWNGSSYTYGDLNDAFNRGELDRETRDELREIIFRQMADAYGDLLPQMIVIRNQTAKDYGYDNYAEFAYREIYHRSYTPQEMTRFHALVKQYLAPIFHEARKRQAAPILDNMPSETVFSGEEALEQLLPYFSLMSDELAESAVFLSEHHCTDLEPSQNKLDASYVISIPYYNLNFLFIGTKGDLNYLLALIHELGHNNYAYWHNVYWNSPYDSYDTLEVHSQGLETLMMHYYPELFGDEAEAVRNFKLCYLLESILEGCLEDELQQWAYAEADVTKEQIGAKYRELAAEYGLVDADNPDTELYRWASIEHNFTGPFYYISYATSAAGALHFWDESQKDFFAAVDDYLRFSEKSAGLDITDAFAAIGLSSPVSEEYIAELAETLQTVLLGETS